MPPTHVQARVWIPCPDCAPFHIRNSVDAFDLAVGWPHLPAFGLMLALLDADKRVDALVLDPWEARVHRRVLTGSPPG